MLQSKLCGARWGLGLELTVFYATCVHRADIGSLNGLDSFHALVFCFFSLSLALSHSLDIGSFRCAYASLCKWPTEFCFWVLASHLLHHLQTHQSTHGQ